MAVSLTRTSVAAIAAVVILLAMAAAAGSPLAGTASRAFPAGTRHMGLNNIVCASRASLERVVALESDPLAFRTFFVDSATDCLSLEEGTPVTIDQVQFGKVRFHIVGDPRPRWTVRDAIR